MTSRMDKYNQRSNLGSRTTKNQQLYKELYSNKTYTEFTDITKDNVVELSNTPRVTNRRTNNNRVTMFYNNNNVEPKRSTLNMNASYQNIFEEDKEKSYNINDIMEFARKNRTNLDEEERKRKIKSAEYSILSDLSQEKLKEYKERKEKGLTKYDEENLENLIHTITSNSLRKKIDDQLLEDLLPQGDSDTLISKNLLDEIENGKIEDLEDDTKDYVSNTSDFGDNLDKSFYTRSMDLKKEDLMVKKQDDDGEEEVLFEEEEKPGFLRIIIGLVLILIVLGIVGYIFYKYLLVR